MAKLKAHGTEIGTIYGNTAAKRYMSDGKVLKNGGFGWKLHATVKAGIDPAEAFQRAKARELAFYADRPLLEAYRRALHNMAGLSKRWKLHAAIQLMPDDPDGVWSEACDGYGDNVHADIDEVSKLCQLYRLACDESKRLAPLIHSEAVAEATA